MPELMAAMHHERRGGQRLADGAFVDQPLARLDARAQKRIRRGQLQNAPAFHAGHGERLLDVDVLARFERAKANVRVRGGNRQIDDQLHVRVGQQLVHGTSAENAEFLRSRFRAA